MDPIVKRITEKRGSCRHTRYEVVDPSTEAKPPIDKPVKNGKGTKNGRSAPEASQIKSLEDETV